MMMGKLIIQNNIRHWNHVSKCMSFTYKTMHVAPLDRFSISRRNAFPYCTNTTPTKPNTSVILRDLSERRVIEPLRQGQIRIKDKLNSMYKSYEDYSLTSDVREAHKHVDLLQEELKIAQQRRRDISRELSDIRYELQLIYGDLANCKKEEPRYLEIVRKEYETHHKEKQKIAEFDQQDKAERDLFMHLQAAVKTSHEKEKMHTNSAKYWSIVGSLLGALLGICGTAFSFYNRNNTITTMLNQVQSEFILLKEETNAINKNIMELITINKSIQATQTKDGLEQKMVNNSGYLNYSWSAWTWKCSHWVAQKTGMRAIYRYFVPKQTES